MGEYERLHYVEFPANNLIATKHFFTAVFSWSFTDYGETYTSFHYQGLSGGFFQSNQASLTANGSALLVLYSKNLEITQSRIEAAGGKIVQPIFSFPGGRRFHFTEPSGNELSVWSAL